MSHSSHNIETRQTGGRLAAAGVVRRGWMLGVSFALAATVSACGKDDDQDIAFNGIYFQTEATKSEEDRSVITVSVRDASQDIEAAMEAGRFRAVKYCIVNFGSSRIDWARGPDDPVDQMTVTEDDVLLMQGTCKV